MNEINKPTEYTREKGKYHEKAYCSCSEYEVEPEKCNTVCNHSLE